MFQELFILFSIIVIICILLKIFMALLPFFFLEQNLLNKYGHGYAVITGGTDGIGLKITRKLISQRFKVCVVGLKTDKICQNELPSDSILIEGDLSERHIVEEVCKWITDKNPSLLINCAGICIPQIFSTIEKPSKYIDAHISSLVELTSSFIKARNRHGGIVFFSSQVALFSSPYAALYAATKSFTAQFADSLSAENPGLDILCLFPGAVNDTSFFKSFPNHWYFNLIRLIGQKPTTIASLVFKALGRVRLLDTGLLTYVTRIATVFVDQNVINLAGQIVASSLRSQMEQKTPRELLL
ncbi:oxidoreductase, short chain dehydrogenase/reductase family protein [Tritrichomonas foetus]|uniref:Oxidoreductase, short chain dehydrogenase/reductase family protein n=1 Tax=Tritrichomonas foetus TaxID=1144522 RepID=A0A1J4KVY2_9EUKA|nr:oxidoreductase, short chain dehydrogenase/reductase family protein [Tritrichomonas foetus]|eukprot:OHT15473.1 oxidoreductase, short chain dehydrogenase/reductase family protein [Tritrichomonas foetus]